jgi:hypothetical protein
VGYENLEKIYDPVYENGYQKRKMINAPGIVGVLKVCKSG